jgi:hypothetical protein
LVIQLSMVLFLFIVILFGAFVNKNRTTDFDLIMFGIVFLFIGVHMGNLLYNFKLLRVYNDEDSGSTFNKSFSVVLLVLYTLGCIASIITIASSIYDALTIDRHPGLLNNSFYVMLLFMFIMFILSIWIIILQIKLLRILKRRQLAKADELLAQLGTDSENLR